MDLSLVIDTNAYSAFFRGNPNVRETMENADTLILPSIVVGELFTGFEIGNRTEINYAEFNHFIELPGVKVHQVGLNEARHYANLVKNLRILGKPIPSNDIWIAATALTLGATLLTADKHFATIAGLLTRNFPPQNK